MSKPILCLDFDGVLHSYTSGWKGADIVPDPAVDGAMRFIWDASEHFKISVFSSRSNQRGGKAAMQEWLYRNFIAHWSADLTRADAIYAEIEWPSEKPAAFITIDDRALTFEGEWGNPKDLLAFKPWNKRPLGATGTFPFGKLNDDDQGALKIGIAYDKVDGIVRVDFGKPVAWLGLPPAEAIQLGQLLIARARDSQ
jgi:hypothetical protein